MEPNTVKTQQKSTMVKHVLIWGLAVFLAVLCLGIYSVIEFEKYTSAKAVENRYSHFTSEMLSSYDPYGFNKKYLAVAESEGFSIDLPDMTHAGFFEIMVEGEYSIEYYHDSGLLAEDKLSSDNAAIVCNGEDPRKKIISVPSEAAEAGYDQIVLIPYAGDAFTVSYFSLLESMENNVVMGATVPFMPARAYDVEGAGSQQMVQGLLAFLQNWDADKINLQVESVTTELNIQLLRLENEDGDELAEFPEESILPKTTLYNAKNGRFYQAYSLPVSAQEYFPYDVYVCYRYEDSDEIKRQKVNPFNQDNEEVYEGTQIRTKDNMSAFSNLKLQDGKVFFTDSYVVLNEALFIPKGLTFVIKEGQTIDFHNNAFIICRSPVSVEGTEKNPVNITTTDNSQYSGLAVIQAGGQSQCSYMICDNLGELSSGIYHLTGAVTFYESDVDFDNCQFLNNRSEDGLNVVRSNLNVTNSIFKNTYQDAFDSDFSHGVFDGCDFEQTGNDAFDVSTSEFTVKNTTFSNIHDKAVSVGEASKIEIENLRASDVQIGIGAKDSSVVKASNVIIKDAFIGFCAYQKKPEFGPCTMTIEGYSLEGKIDFNYLIEENDMLIVNGDQWFASQKQKQALIIQRLINEEPIN